MGPVALEAAPGGGAVLLAAQRALHSELLRAARWKMLPLGGLGLAA